MRLEDISGFESSPRIREALLQYGVSKHIKEGEIILSENSHIRVIPIVISGSIKVIRTDEDGK